MTGDVTGRHRCSSLNLRYHACICIGAQCRIARLIPFLSTAHAVSTALRLSTAHAVSVHTHTLAHHRPTRSLCHVR
eukprot:521128-Rhodomonas_salina.1